MGTVIEVRRTHLASGEPAPLIEVHEITPEKRGQTMPDAVAAWIRPMNPTRTQESGVYSYNSPECGKGTIAVTMLGELYRERMDEKIQMLEIERMLGSAEPDKVSDTMAWMYAIRLQVRNPYSLILLGLMMTSIGAFQALSVSLNSSYDLFNRIGLSILGTTIAFVGIIVFLKPGARRIRWWHQARALVKRRKDKMPTDLQLFP